MRKIAHVLAGFVILIHAFEKFEQNEPSYPYLTIAGIVFMLVAIFHHHIGRRFPYVDSLFLVIEAAVYAMIALEYFYAGKKWLPWAWVFATIANLAFAFIKGHKSRKKHRRKKRSESVLPE